jgi:alpha-beta hydrolase superfamily lysophospholipase
MKIESFEETFLEEFEGIHSTSYSFNRGSQNDFIYGKRFDFSNDGVHSTKELPNLLFLHDIGEHGSRYGDFFHSFLKQNTFTSFSVATLDFRGHGKSSGTRGHLKSVDDLCLDVVALVNHWEGDQPIILMGQGLGAIVALKIIHLHFSHLEKKIAGLVLINPGLKLNWTVPSVLEGLARQEFLPFNKMKMPFELEGKLFCGDSHLAEEFDSDPLVNHTLTWGSLLELQHNASLIRTSAYYLDIPVFVGLSGKGRLYNRQVTELFAKGIADIRLISYHEAAHDLLHNFDCEKLSQDVYNWLKDNSFNH